jgi:hypothetical protein
VLLIRFTRDHAALVRDVRRLVWEVEPALPLHWNDLFADLIARRYWQPRGPLRPISSSRAARAEPRAPRCHRRPSP